MVSIVDGVLHHLGKPGGFHLLVTVLLCCNFFPITFHHLSIIFYGDNIPHTCRLPEGWPWHKKFSIPKVTAGEQSKYDQCHMFVDPNSANLGTKSCVYGWEFYPQDREWTIIAEWGLVCEREYLVTLASVVYHGGVMFGGLVFGTLADKFGRKPLMLFTLYVQTAISIGMYFVQNFILFVILRFVHGLLLQGLQCTTICLVMELLPMRYRTAAGMGCSIVWALAMISLSLVSYSVQHWRYIQLAISLPCVVTFLYIWLIPESVRWLLTVMKTDNALLAARKFEQFNKRPLGEEFSKDVESATKQIASSVGHVDSYGMRELLLQGSKLRISSLVLCFCWFATSSLYHGLSMLLIGIGSNRYTSTVILGTVDLVAFVVMYFLLVRFGRKRPLCALLVVCGAVCISTVIAENLEKGDGLEVYVVSTVMALVERSCIAACLAGLTICAAELFPTVVRTFGIGVCLFCGQVGWIVAPQVMKLGQFSIKSLPWIVFGILTLLAGLLVLLLPETLTKPLPDTLEDMESFESRKAPVKNKEKEAAPTAPTGYVDWKTTYKQKIEEANGSLGLADAGEDHKVEHSEKRWYSRNYSRRSAKVVRFYGLDSSEDPCQEVKTHKKQRIRMVRFSFENEEFCMDSHAHALDAARRFSIIREEPELETAFGDDTAESSLEDIAEEGDDAPVETDVTLRPDPSSPDEQSSIHIPEVGDLPNSQNLFPRAAVLSAEPVSPSRFVVRRVSESQLPLVAAPDDCRQPEDGTGSSVEDFKDAPAVRNSSRFVVRRVSESQLTPTDPLDHSSHPSTLAEDSPQVLVQNSSDSNVSPAVSRCGSSGSSRFTVRRISESQLQQAGAVPQVERALPDAGTEPSNDISSCVPVTKEDTSRFTVRRISESKLVSSAPPDEGGQPDETGPGATGALPAAVTPDVLDAASSPEDGCARLPVASLRFTVQRVSESMLSPPCDCGPEEHCDASEPPATSRFTDGGQRDGGKVANSVSAVPSLASRFTVRRVSESEPLPQLPPAPDGIDKANEFSDVPGEVANSDAGSAPGSESKPQPLESGVSQTGDCGKTCNGAASRFTVRRVSESKIAEPVSSMPSGGAKVVRAAATNNSRFTVRRVSESKLVPPVAGEEGTIPAALSRFVVQEVPEPQSHKSHRPTNGGVPLILDASQLPLTEKSAKFLVQCVGGDDMLNIEHLNNNNNNNDGGKYAGSGTADVDEYKNLQNLHLSNSAGLSAYSAANGTSRKLIVKSASQLDPSQIELVTNS